MKKAAILLILILLTMPAMTVSAQASLVSDHQYRVEQHKINKQAIKQIRKLFDLHNRYANNHDLKNLEALYSESYINNDGFNKEVYFKSIEDTWKSCSDLTYKTEILSIDVNGDFANVNVIESATGTVQEDMEFMSVSGEIHSKSTGIYHLEQINGKWYIKGETALTDESSLLYGDARFMNIELQAPTQVSSGETYTTTVKVDADDNTFIIGAIDRDSVKYPASTPKSELRAMPQSQILERLLTANTDNLNEYTVASLAISKAVNAGREDFKIYMAGLACVMKRINVIPKNKFVETEE